MDEKILVEVYIPAAQLSLDVVLPISFRISQIKDKLFLMLQECSQGAFIFSKESVFYSSRLQINLLDDQVLKDIDIRTGDEIIVW
ncbi:hypothetical protein [Amedibacillus sp. YH-ame10]